MALSEQFDLLKPGTPINRDNCDREPIQAPGAIQPHGLLLAVSSQDHVISQASQTTREWLDREPEALLGTSLLDWLAPSAVDELARRAGSPTPNLRPVRTRLGERDVDAFAYRVDDVLVLEFEATAGSAPAELAEFQDQLARSVDELRHEPSPLELLATAARVVRELTGFDRVWAYRFEADDHGVIVAEERHAHLPAFLGLHYPATDIPPQARALYLENRLRFIRDVAGTAAPIVPAANPASGEWLDLSAGVLRAVSPIHIAYLKNMGATASMSIALAVRGRLWGLISAHHYSGPLPVAHSARAACEFIGLACSMQLEALEVLESSQARAVLADHRLAVLEEVARSATVLEGLAGAGDRLLGCAGATGAAVCVGDEVALIGITPGQDAVRALVSDLRRAPDPSALCTDALSQTLPDHADLAETASGVLAVSLAARRGNYLVFFRPEWARTVAWGGHGRSDGSASAELGPDGSYAQWVESVRGHSRPWTGDEIDSVAELRSALGSLLLDRVEEIAALNAELARSNAELDAFAYVVAHDLKEPLRGIHNYATFVIEDYRDTLDGGGVGRLSEVLSMAERMGGLLDSLLEYSRAGRAELELAPVAVSDLVDYAREMLAARFGQAGLEFVVHDADVTVPADLLLLRHVFTNLVSNALKYHPEAGVRIEVSARPQSQTRRGLPADAERDPVAVCVRDNGIGIADEYHDAIFEIFRRLHGRERYGGGSGAGLTIARRIVERHGGSLWLDDSTPGQGSCFCFTTEAP